MIIGCKYWNDRDRFYTQENNSTETLLKLAGVKSYLETCGSSSVVNACTSVGADFKYEHLKVQPEDLVTSILNNMHNYEELRSYRPNLTPGTIPGNRVPQYHPYAAKTVFGVQSEFKFDNKFDPEFVLSMLRLGCAVGICYKSPGHFTCIVAYDTEKKAFLTKDSWSNTIDDGTNGFLRPIPQKWIDSNIQNYYIIYHPKES